MELHPFALANHGQPSAFLAAPAGRPGRGLGRDHQARPATVGRPGGGRCQRGRRAASAGLRRERVQQGQQRCVPQSRHTGGESSKAGTCPGCPLLSGCLQADHTQAPLARARFASDLSQRLCFSWERSYSLPFFSAFLNLLTELFLVCLFRNPEEHGGWVSALLALFPKGHGA